MRTLWARRVVRWAAVVCVTFGGLVALGWMRDAVELVSVVDGYPPVHINAAVALLAAGAGLYGIAENRRGWLLAGALVTLLIGGLTFLEYVAGVDLGVDRLLLSDPSRFEIRPEYSGRMAASTALAFTLVGAAFLTLLYARAEEASRGIVGTVGLTLLALSVVTLLSYSTGVLSDLRFGAVTGVAIPTAIAFLGIGTSLIIGTWEQNRPALLPAWMPLAAGVATLCTTLILTRAVTSQEEMRGRRQVQAIAGTASAELTSELQATFRLVARMAAFTGDQDPLQSGEWATRMRRVMEDNPGVRRVVWLDSSWSMNTAVGMEAAPVDSTTLVRVLADEAARGASGGRAPVGIVELAGKGPGTMLLAGAPACSDSRCGGVLLAFIDGGRLVRDALALYPSEYGARVRGKSRELYRNERPATDVAWFATDTVHVGGLRWSVSAWPTSTVQGLYRSDLREVIAVLGVIVAILVSLLLRLLHFTQAAARTVERQRLQQALDSSTDGLWEQDLDTGESHRSEGVWRGLGYDPHTLTPRGATAVWKSLVHPEDRARVERALDDHLAGRTDTLDYEARLQARNGEWHWIVERGRVVERAPDGRPIRLVGAIADVTERKHAVQALAASERRFRAMFDGGEQLKTLLDLDGTCLEANRVALDFARIPLSRMRGKVLWETPSWAASSVRVEQLRKACEEAKLGKVVQYQEELDGPDGTLATIEFSIKPILGDEGQVIQLLAEGRDVTERKQVEATLRELESISSMGRLAAKVAHEINNPLAGIQNSFLLVKDAIPATHPYFRYVGAIEREIDRIAGITRQLYETYRPEPEGASNASIGTIIADAVAMIQQINRSSTVTIGVDTSGSPGVVGVPAGLLRQAIYNLVQNAIDASPPQGHVAVRAWQEGRSFTLSVTDAGPGVPPESREQIFEPFTTSKAGTSNSGMGLGLALVRRSVLALGGTIKVTDAEGGGAVFTVCVPLKPDA
jgi:PAS domain S-box-containing protein